MDSFQGELIQDERGREVVCFTTPSGVRAVVYTSITMAALDKMVRKLERKLMRAYHVPDGGGKLKSPP
jgi:hypothetical protein